MNLFPFVLLYNPDSMILEETRVKIVDLICHFKPEVSEISKRGLLKIKKNRDFHFQLKFAVMVITKKLDKIKIVFFCGASKEWLS